MAHCDNCGGEIIFEETPNSVHYGKHVCSNCGKWFCWIKNPENDGLRTKTSKYNFRDIMFRCYGEHAKEQFCFFCLRKKQQLGLNETLTIDHIEELSKGGKDELGNLQILCSARHKLKNWMRLYNNWHTKKENKK